MNRRIATVAVAMAIALAGSYGAFALSSNGVFDTPSETKFVTDGDTLVLEATSGQVVRGVSDRPAGTNLSVRIRSDNGTRFIYSAPATVDESGEFRATFDLSGISGETEFRASVYTENRTRLANTTGRLVT